MMRGRVVPPAPGYLEAVRETTRAHGALLIFDEVKTGLTIAAGGATERFGVRPDMVALAKALGGGLPSGAIGMTADLADYVATGRVHQVGTFNGNPLSMAAARASLEEVLTPPAYERLEALGERMRSGCQAVIDEHGLPAEAVALGSKGSVAPRRRARRAHLAVVAQPRPVRDSRRAGVERHRRPRRGRRGPLRRGLRGARGRAQPTTVRLCSRMNCGRYQGPSPPLPVVPLDFQPAKVCVPGQAPVVAPARRFT